DWIAFIYLTLPTTLYFSLRVFSKLSDLTQKHPYLKPRASLFEAI
ncbi:MAG: hypothetical protein RI984_2063, partial [Pseudomonadota bacterium]